MCAWEQNRSLLTRGSSSRPSNKLCTSHTEIQWHADTQIHTLWIIHERGVSQSQWHAKSLTNAQRLTERQSLFYLDGGDHWCVCETVGGASVCVCECVLSVMYCIVLEAFAWPSPAVCDQITVSLLIPLHSSLFFFTLAYSSISLLPLPLSSLSLYSSLCVDDSVIQMERNRKRAGCGAAMSVRSHIVRWRALYHKPLEKDTCHLTALHVFLTNKAGM